MNGSNALGHQPVLVDEAVKALAIKPHGIYVDATFGRGGHSAAILNGLSHHGRLLAVDKDPEAVRVGQAVFEGDQRVSIQQGSFALLKQITDAYHFSGQLDGLLLDLGVSSPQLDDPKRGFGFTHDGPLDMRMDPGQTLSAAAWLANAAERQIEAALGNYGEERYARRIARAIVKERACRPITRTAQLADLIARAVPRWERHRHPATRSFQALRIVVNRELEALAAVLPQSLELLRAQGRLVVISFHSLEDRLVKRFIHQYSGAQALPRRLPVSEAERPTARVRAVGRAVRPCEAECHRNPRARSAVMRVAECVR